MRFWGGLPLEMRLCQFVEALGLIEDGQEGVEVHRLQRFLLPVQADSRSIHESPAEALHQNYKRLQEEVTCSEPNYHF